MGRRQRRCLQLCWAVVLQAIPNDGDKNLLQKLVNRLELSRKAKSWSRAELAAVISQKQGLPSIYSFNSLIPV